MFPVWPTIEVILIILPDLFFNIFLIELLLNKNVDVKFISITFFHSSKLILIAKLSLVIPALFIKQSKLPPNSAVAVSIKSSIFSICEMSNFKIFIFLNFDFNSSNFSILVPVANILAPFSLSLFTIEFPIPPEAPVIIIFFFF